MDGGDKGENTKNLHEKHRQYLIREFLEKGIDHMKPHVALEVLLFYVIPRADTHKTARNLLEKFGSVHNVFNVSYDALKTVDGIGDKSAELIYLCGMLAKRYYKDKHKDGKSLNSSEKLIEYCRDLFLGMPDEETRCIFLDDDLKLIRQRLVSKGTPGKVYLPVREMIEIILAGKCNKVVLTHNHPVGSCIPSRTDVDTTKEILELVKRLDVDIVDHVIVGKDGEWSMRERGTLPDIW